ncbi:hypothetical protein FQZ97_1005840 [compost metagenome]
MHRPHRHLDREGDEEGNEDRDLLVHRQLGLVPLQDVERAGLVVQVQQRNQRQQRAQQRVQEELEGRVHTVRTAPDADDDVHRNQRGLEEHVEQHAVERAEHADHQAGQDQERGHVLGHALGDHFPGRDHHDHGDEGGQHHEPHRQAVDTQQVVDAEALDPVRLLDELHRRGGTVEVEYQRQRDDKAGDRAEQRHPPHEARAAVRAEGQDQQAEKDRQPD